MITNEKPLWLVRLAKSPVLYITSWRFTIDMLKVLKIPRGQKSIQNYATLLKNKLNHMSAFEEHLLSTWGISVPWNTVENEYQCRWLILKIMISFPFYEINEQHLASQLSLPASGKERSPPACCCLDGSPPLHCAYFCLYGWETWGWPGITWR